MFGVSSIILQTLETIHVTSRELVACNVVRFVAASSPRCQAILRLPSTFQTFLNMLEVGIEALIMRAVELETSLSRLDERLDTIRDITGGETKVYLSEKDRILDGAWARFGANRQRISLLDQNLHALEMIHEHHRFANSHISGIESELQVMKASLEYLRPLASSLLLYSVGPSVALIIQQIEMGVGRLNNRGAGDQEMVEDEADVWEKLRSSDILYSGA